MLRQTAITSSSFVPSLAASSPSSFPLPLSLLRSSCPTPHSHSSQGEKDKGTMDTALKTSRRTEVAPPPLQQRHAAEELSWVVERGNPLGEMFSVEDLLDLGEFAEPEKEAAEQLGAAAREEAAAEAANSDFPSVLFSGLPPPPPEIDLPAHDAEELEWVSLIMDDSLSELPPPCAAYRPPAPQPPPPAQSRPRGREPHHKRRLPGPTICTLSTEALVPVKDRRSKRSRAAVWSLSVPAPFSDSSSSSSTITTATATSSCSSSSPFLLYDAPVPGAVEPSLLFDDNPQPTKKPKPKKRGRKPKLLSSARAVPSAASGGGERRCSHCGVQKTPQWRAGPQGSKTLCNACGVRYKSGRLLPEYRPACSPTFISNIHSNSHRMVLEMRRKKEAALLASAAPPVASF